MTRALYHAERLSGCCRQIQEFAAYWSANGAFALVVTSGVRNDLEQARLFAERKTRARTAAETPHGRGCAMDCAPVRTLHDGKVSSIWLPTDGPEALDLYSAYGVAGEQMGLMWGGRWRGEPFGVVGDQFHLEVSGWRGYPERLPVNV